MTGGVNIYLDCCVSLLAPTCAVCLYVSVFVCDIKSEYQKSKNPHYLSDLHKLDELLHKTEEGSSGTKVPRLDICRSIAAFSKITHQMWRDHSFSQRNKTTKRPVKEVGGDREEGCLDKKILKRGSQYRRVSIK